jgi:hypothetical protein
MAKKHVHSKDPRKPAIVAALKRRSGGNKVTLLVELEDGKLFEGRCLKYVGAGNGRVRAPIMGGNGSYEELGTFQVSASEVSQLTGKGR